MHNYNLFSEPTCHTLRYEDFYVDPVSKCRSKIRLEQRRCMGSCDAKQQLHKQQHQNQQQIHKQQLHKQHQNQQQLQNQQQTPLKQQDTTSKSCCRPKKLKQQIVSLICPDGATLNTRVALVKNCQCFGCWKWLIIYYYN